MRTLIMAALIATATAPIAITGANAQGHHGGGSFAGGGERGFGHAGGDWRQFGQYDHDIFEPGFDHYYPERYYRDGGYYPEWPISRLDRIYRGGDGRYYCRRSDGTTGLILGGVAGALIGNGLDNGSSSPLGALVGGGAGALLGQQLDRGDIRCR